MTSLSIFATTSPCFLLSTPWEHEASNARESNSTTYFFICNLLCKLLFSNLTHFDSIIHYRFIKSDLVHIINVWRSFTIKCQYNTVSAIFLKPCEAICIIDGIPKGWDIGTVVGSASAMDEMTCRLIGGKAGIPDLHGVTLFPKTGFRSICGAGADLRSGSVVD